MIEFRGALDIFFLAKQRRHKKNYLYTTRVSCSLCHHRASLLLLLRRGGGLRKARGEDEETKAKFVSSPPNRRGNLDWKLTALKKRRNLFKSKRILSLLRSLSFSPRSEKKRERAVRFCYKNERRKAVYY